MENFVRNPYPYAITITLKPICYKLRPLTQYKRSITALNDLIQSELLQFADLRPEMTKANNIHYHGVILLEQSKQIYANDYVCELFRKLPYFGFICLKELTDAEGWAAYITKQTDEIEHLLYSKTFLRPRTITEMLQEEVDNEEICKKIDAYAAEYDQWKLQNPNKEYPVHTLLTEDNAPGGWLTQ